jgi:hypothetical protein
MISEKEVKYTDVMRALPPSLTPFVTGQNQRAHAHHGFSSQVVLAGLGALRLRVCPSHVYFDNGRWSVHVLAPRFGGVLRVYRLGICFCGHHVLLHDVQCFQQGNIRFVHNTAPTPLKYQLNLAIVLLTRALQARCSLSCSASLALWSTLAY